mgnify:CR=1 FL=1
MNIKILGTGYTKCQSLEKATRDIAKQLKINTKIEKVTDIAEIINYGIINFPAFVINDKDIFSGNVPFIIFK